MGAAVDVRVCGVINCSRKLSSVTVEVTDQTGDLVALFQGLAYRKDEPLEKYVQNA
jgi:hypothetical protein